MVNSYRLVYTDDTGTLQKLGEMTFSGTDTAPGEATGQLKKARWHPRSKNMKKLSVWADENLYGELPVAVTDHEGSEPEILWQEYDGSSWVTKFRGFPTSKGIITENGDVKFTLFSFLQWLGKKRVQLDPDTNSNLVNTDNVTVMEEVLPDGYVLDAPAEGDVSGGYESIERYRLDDQRRVAFRDLTRDYNWSLKTLPEQDGNGNWKVRYEPDGYGGTVDTVFNQKSQSTGTSPGEFKEWSNLRVKDVVNKAVVIGNDSNRERIVSDPQVNQSSIDTYGERFDRVQVGFLESKAEADRIAQNIVDNKSEPTEGGRVTVAPRYSEDVSNDSFELRDSIRDIDGVYTCVRQINFYPENRTYLDFEFEADAEKKASSRENLRDERQRITGNQSAQVGNQAFSGDTGSAPSDTNVVGSVTDNQSDTSIAGSVGFDEPAQVPANAQLILTGTGTNNVTLTGNVPFLETGQDVFHGGIIVQIEVGNFWNTGSSTSGDITWDWFLLDDNNNTLDSGTESTNEGQVTTVEFANGDLDEGEEWNILLSTSDGVFSNVDSERFNTYMRAEVYSYPIHRHDDDFDTDDNNHGHGDDFDSNDNQHGGSGDATGQHGTSGSTDPKEVNVPDEVKINRG